LCLNLTADGRLINSELFEAYLACQTKCFLRHAGAADSENTVASWHAERNERYRRDAINSLAADWELLLDLNVQSDGLEATIHATQIVHADEKRRTSKMVPLHLTSRSIL
jgi:hypothetical protein